MYENVKPSIDSSDSNDEDSLRKCSKKDDRDEKVQRCVEELKEKHGQTAYTSMQYCIWTESKWRGV